MWVTNEGKHIPYNKITDSHILNIKKYIENKADKGYKVEIGGGSSPDDFRHDVKIVFGEEAKEQLDYKGICEEIDKRNLITNI